MYLSLNYYLRTVSCFMLSVTNDVNHICFSSADYRVLGLFLCD